MSWGCAVLIFDIDGMLFEFLWIFEILKKKIRIVIYIFHVFFAFYAIFNIFLAPPAERQRSFSNADSSVVRRRPSSVVRRRQLFT